MGIVFRFLHGHPPCTALGDGGGCVVLLGPGVLGHAFVRVGLVPSCALWNETQLAIVVKRAVHAYTAYRS